MMIARLSFMICFYEYMYSLLTIKKRYVFVIIYKLTYRFNLVVVIDLGHNLGFFFVDCPDINSLKGRLSAMQILLY